MKRTALHTAMALAMGAVSLNANAALTTNILLDFTGTFGMEVSPGYVVPTTISSGPDGGISIGVAQDTNGHASHGGSPEGGFGGLGKEWLFFSNSGMEFTTNPIIVVNPDVNGDGGITQTLDFSGWRVTWNSIPAINMGGGIQDCGTTGSPNPACGGPTGTFDNGTQLATIVCSAADCPAGSTFTLTYAAVVPVGDPSNFGGVNYTVNLTGSIVDTTKVPITNNDSDRTIVDNPVTIDVVSNDNPKPDDNSITITSGPTAGGSTDTSNLDGTVIYTPGTGLGGPVSSPLVDTFVYAGSNVNGPSNPAVGPGIVTVNVTVNEAPVAVDDTGAVGTAVLDNTPLVIDILANDTDANNDPGQPGGIDVQQVTIANNSGNTGTCTDNNDGTISYSQVGASVGVVDTCTYTVKDIDVNGALTSNTATVTITVTETTSDWPTTLPPNVIPILTFEPGVGVPDQSIKPEKSWFSMQVSASTIIYTTIKPGPDGGFIIGYDQPATGSHTGSPNGSEQPGFTAPWLFFSNTGFDLTRNGGITGNPDGTLDFFTKYVVTWNSIPVINLGGSSQFPEDLGFATITCSDKPCQDGSTFALEYAAHVEDVAGLPASGFNGVPYQLYLEGTVVFLDSSLDASDGTVTNQTRLAAGDPSVPDDATVDLQCVGGCFDYTISGVTTGSRVSIVLPLAGGVPNSPVWRILDNGAWRNFDTSVGDSVKSAPFITGASGMVCPNTGDAAYIDLSNDTSVNLGHQCIQLSITDNGLNDLDPTNGVISDPSGLGTAGIPPFVDNRTSNTSGCSIAATPVNPAQRGDWWLLAGLIGLLGWVRKRCQH